MPTLQIGIALRIYTRSLPRKICCEESKSSSLCDDVVSGLLGDSRKKDAGRTGHKGKTQRCGQKERSQKKRENDYSECGDGGENKRKTLEVQEVKR